MNEALLIRRQLRPITLACIYDVHVKPSDLRASGPQPIRRAPPGDADSREGGSGRANAFSVASRAGLDGAGHLLAFEGQERRELLIEASVNGERWSQDSSRAKVTDLEMVELAQTLQGWTRSVYRFGCAFIHLSNLHDYNDRDPLMQLPGAERRDILEHCRHYHGGPSVDNAGFADLIPFLPSVFEKIAGNLDCYLEALESEDTRAANEI